MITNAHPGARFIDGYESFASTTFESLAWQRESDRKILFNSKGKTNTIRKNSFQTSSVRDPDQPPKEQKLQGVNWCWSCTNLNSLGSCSRRQTCSENSICFIEERNHYRQFKKHSLFTIGCKVR